MDTIGKRIVASRKPLSRKLFSKKLEVHENTLGNWERDLIRPDEKSLVLIAQKSGVSFEWLVSGVGDIYKTADMSAINKGNAGDNTLISLDIEKKGVADVGCFASTELDALRQENTRLYKKVESLLEENGNLRVEVERLRRLIATGGVEVVREDTEEEEHTASTA